MWKLLKIFIGIFYRTVMLRTNILKQIFLCGAAALQQIFVSSFSEICQWKWPHKKGNGLFSQHSSHEGSADICNCPSIRRQWILSSMSWSKGTWCSPSKCQLWLLTGLCGAGAGGSGAHHAGRGQHAERGGRWESKAEKECRDAYRGLWRGSEATKACWGRLGKVWVLLWCVWCGWS